MEDLTILSTCGVKGRPPRAPTIKCVKWQAPRIQVMKINVDGGTSGSPALYAIELAFDRGWTNIWLESDSTYVVHILKSSHHVVPWRLLTRWHRVRRLKTDLHMVVSHIYKEGNAVADRLTREEVDSFRGAPFSLPTGFVPKEGFPVARFLTGPRPLDSYVVLWF
ncbi:hypothetical protein ACS0TY_033683 [Phlomoides rotata]